MRVRLFITLCCLALALAAAPHKTAKAQTDSPKAELLQAVGQRARQDARAERGHATFQDLNTLYGERAKAAGVSLDEVIDAYEAAYASARPPESFFKKYLPHLGWITALVLFVLTFFRDSLRDVLGPRLKALGDRLYDRLAGYPLFWWKARANYRKSLVGLYKRFKIPFMADRYLDMDQIYVPLKVEGASDIEQIVDFGEVAKYKRLVVTGQPGSGKSMLLRRLALLYATGGLKKLPDQPTPVLLELRRLNEEEKGVFEHLVGVFRLHKFPEADSFLRRSLARGKLMLLFDGLDEVDSGKRAAEVRKLRDFIQENDSCRVIITCRTAVYRGEFDDVVDQKLKIIDFSDQQIESFLSAWPGMPANKSVGQLLAALDERPLIKALARRPLLLTIIAFLYTEVEEFRLPHSRADFYKRAADVLLGGLKGELNRYEAVEKQFVLEHLALHNQTKAVKDADDRLTLDRPTVIEEIRKVLPKIGRKEEEAPAVLEEIVERSSLMLPLDNKSRYAFSHLTLQEYFAASALKVDHSRLLEFFAADRDAWRETAKLWCGLAQDSTEFVGALYRLDPVTALECLADAKYLSTETADSVIDSFKDRLGSADGAGDSVTKAFAAAATGGGPRNRRVFDFLVEALYDMRAPQRQAAAATALSFTNNPEAAEHLIRHLSTVPEAAAALSRMGDLAVPALSAYIETTAFPLIIRNISRAVGVLASIGTPKAVETLVRLLWERDRLRETLAALTLGGELRVSQVEAAVRSLRLPQEYKQREWYRWVWSPFEDGESTMSVVAGRIGFILNHPGCEIFFEHFTIDPRIAIPLAVHRNQEAHTSTGEWASVVNLFAWKNSLLIASMSSDLMKITDEAILDGLRQGQIENPAHEMLNEAVKRGDLIERKLARALEVLSLLDAPRQLRLLYRLSRGNQPTLDHWRNIFRPVEFSFNGSAYHYLIALVLFTLPALSLSGFLINLESSLGSVSGLLTNVLFAAALLYLFLPSYGLTKADDSDVFATELLFSPLYLLNIGQRFLPNTKLKTNELSPKLFLVSFPILNVCFGSLLFRHWFAVPWVIAIWVVLFGSLYLLYWLGKRKERRAGNPLVGLLPDPARPDVGVKVK